MRLGTAALARGSFLLGRFRVSGFVFPGLSGISLEVTIRDILRRAKKGTSKQIILCTALRIWNKNGLLG